MYFDYLLNGGRPTVHRLTFRLALDSMHVFFAIDRMHVFSKGKKQRKEKIIKNA